MKNRGKLGSIIFLTLVLSLLTIPTVFAYKFGDSDFNLGQLFTDAFASIGTFVSAIGSDPNAQYGLLYILFFILILTTIMEGVRRISVFGGQGQVNRQGQLFAVAIAFIATSSIFILEGQAITDRIENLTEPFGAWAGFMVGLIIALITYRLLKDTEIFGEGGVALMGLSFGIGLLMAGAMLAQDSVFGTGILFVAIPLLILLFTKSTGTLGGMLGGGGDGGGITGAIGNGLKKASDGVKKIGKNIGDETKAIQRFNFSDRMINSQINKDNWDLHEKLNRIIREIQEIVNFWEQAETNKTIKTREYFMSALHRLTDHLKDALDDALKLRNNVNRLWSNTGAEKNIANHIQQGEKAVEKQKQKAVALTKEYQQLGDESLVAEVRELLVQLRGFKEIQSAQKHLANSLREIAIDKERLAKILVQDGDKDARELQNALGLLQSIQGQYQRSSQLGKVLVYDKNIIEKLVKSIEEVIKNVSKDDGYIKLEAELTTKEKELTDQTQAVVNKEMKIAELIGKFEEKIRALQRT